VEQVGGKVAQEREQAEREVEQMKKHEQVEQEGEQVGPEGEQVEQEAEQMMPDAKHTGEKERKDGEQMDGQVGPEKGDLVVEAGDMDEAPTFQKAAHEGDGAAMVAKEADQETAGEGASVVSPVVKVAGAGSESIDGKPSAKAVLCGDTGVGKTSLLARLVTNQFTSSRATIGVDLQTQMIPLPGGENLKLQIWDTAGQEQFHSLTSSYFRRAHAVLLVYDVNEEESFKSLLRWISEVDRLAPAEVCKMIVGAKCDDGVEPAVSEATALALAAKHGAMCERCSALNAKNVKEMFERLAVRIVRNGFDPEGKTRASGEDRVSLSSQTSEKGKKKGCC
ncbi:MAG: hypothetical protein SGPRY_014903, partial [Prymnesium sp.]